MRDDEREDTTIYKVVVNHEEQYSIWPADRENALGWNDAGLVADLQTVTGAQVRNLSTGRLKPPSGRAHTWASAACKRCQNSCRARASRTRVILNVSHFRLSDSDLQEVFDIERGVIDDRVQQ